MKRFAAALALSILVLFPFAPNASAHVFLDDGNIDVFSHIEPDDDPIAESKADLYFIVTDRTSKFSPAACDCVASVKKSDGTVLFSQRLYRDTVSPDDETHFSYTFPARGVYDLEIKGQPLVSGAFQSFEVHRIIRVERTISMDSTATGTTMGDASDGESIPPALYALMGAAAILLIGLFIWESKRRDGRPGTPGKSTVLSVLILLAFFFHDVQALNFVSDTLCHGDQPCCGIQASDVSFAADAPKVSISVEPASPSSVSLSYIQEFSADISNNSPPFRT